MTGRSVRARKNGVRAYSGDRPKRVVFFVDESTGILRESDQPEVAGLLGFDPDPEQTQLWEALGTRDASVELLLPEDTDEASVAAVSADVLPEVQVRVASDRKDTFGCNASTRAETVVVSADRMQRAKALEAGARAVPHGFVAKQLVDGDTPVFVAIRSNAAVPREFGEILPYHAERIEDGSWLCFAVFSTRQLVDAAASGASVTVIALNLEREDPVLMRIDQPATNEVREELKRHEVLFSEGGRVLLGLSEEHRVGQLRIAGAHGCVKVLRPSPGFGRPTQPARVIALRELERAGRWPARSVELISPHVLKHIRELLERHCQPSADDFANDVARYSGQADLDDKGSIESRHVDHPDNARVVSALLRDLRGLGYCAYTHKFEFEGRMLSSVIADLPGTGSLRIHPKTLDELRAVLVRRDLPTDQLLHSVGGMLNRRDDFSGIDRAPLRAGLTAAALLRPWWPWWRLNCLRRLPHGFDRRFHIPI
jgi:hypothetical protein